MKNLIVNLVLIALFITILGCNEKNEIAHPDPKPTVVTALYSFYLDQKKYEETNVRRADPDLCTFTWDIINISRSGNTLTIEISRPKDCVLKYEIIWDGAIMESYPMMAHIFINALSEGCADQEETLTDQLVVDLEEAFQEVPASTLSATNFYIRDFCSLTDIECTENCDVSVSND